jgi:hypothetical protein
MAYKLVTCDWCPELEGYRHSFVLDSNDDAKDLPECCPGSTAVAASADGSAYMVNASGEWCELGSGGGGGGSGDSEEWFNDGNTHIWISLPEGRTSPALRIGVSGTVTVDWGDGSDPDVLTGTNVNSNRTTPVHEYDRVGDYVITLSGGEIGFNGSSSAITDLSSPWFYARWTITKIELGDNVSGINANAFSSCEWLGGVKIPAQITKFGERAFANCSSLQNINIPDGVTSIPGWMIGNGYSLKNIDIPDGVTSIGDNAFRYCNCFRGTIIIPASVMSIGGYAFYNCVGVLVYDFTKHTSVPTLVAGSAFNNMSSDCQIRVPAALVDEWKAATNWSTFASKIVGV